MLKSDAAGSFFVGLIASLFVMMLVEALTGDWYAAWLSSIVALLVLESILATILLAARRIEQALHMEYRWGKVGISHGATVMQSDAVVELEEK